LLLLLLKHWKENKKERRKFRRENTASSTVNHIPYVVGWQQKGKAIPLQPLTGPEGSRRLRLPDFKKIGTRKW
jgi:hypothetical protein